MSTPGAVQLTSGRFPGIGSRSPSNITLSADQDDWEPANWWSVNHYGLAPSPDSTDRTIGGFLAIKQLTQLEDGGNPGSRKRFQIVGDPGDSAIVRVKHDDSGQTNSANRVMCPSNKWMVLGVDDSWDMSWYNSRWQAGHVSFATQPALSPGSIGSDQVGWNPSGFARSRIVRISASVALTIHSFESLGSLANSDQFLGVHKRKTFINVSSSPITLANQSGTDGSAARRLLIPGGDLAVLPDEQFDAFYDDVTDRWRVL